MSETAHHTTADIPDIDLVVLLPLHGGADAVPTVLSLIENSVLPHISLCITTATTPLPESLSDILDHHAGTRRISWTVHHQADPAPNVFVSLGHAAQLSEQADLALVAPGTLLPYAWDARLRKATRADNRIAAAIPLCDASPLSSIFDDPAATADPLLTDRLAYCLGSHGYYEVPGLPEVCVYFNRHGWNAVATNPPPSDMPALRWISKHLRASGWYCVLCDYLYVGQIGAQADHMRDPDNEFDEQAFVEHSPLTALRLAIREAISNQWVPAASPGLDSRIVQLHINHIWGGGSNKWVHDFGAGDTTHINMVLTSYRIGERGGQRLALFTAPSDTHPIRVWDITQPIPSTVVSNIEYKRILDGIIDEFAVQTLIVSSLIGHSLDVFSTTPHKIVVCHDYYPICEAINPFFGELCPDCTFARLSACKRDNPLNYFFPDKTSEELEILRHLYVEHLASDQVTLVAPTTSVATTLKKLAPRLSPLPIHIIPHGTDLLGNTLAPPADPAPSAPLKLVVLGRLTRQKGAELLKEAAPALTELAHVTLLGCGEEGAALAREFGWSYREKYRHDELPGILAEIAPHAGLLVSVVPETFSYTLSELMHFGIPPLATAIGSFQDRIADGQTGLLFSPTRTALVELVKRIKLQPEILVTIRANLAQIRPRTVAEMVEDYHRLAGTHASPAARFPIVAGTQTALTEPYRQLTEAYRQLKLAYDQAMDAYTHTETAYRTADAAYRRTFDEYTRVSAELHRITTPLQEWAAEYDSIHPTLRWRLLPKAMRITQALRDKLPNLPGEGDATSGQ